MKKNIVLIIFFVRGLLSMFAQDQDIKGSLYVGTNSTDSDTKIVLRGPNHPKMEESKRDILFQYASAGTSGIRAFRGGSWGNYLQFLTTSDSGPDLKVRMHIDKTGKIGIGTTNPTNLLDVNGTIRSKKVLIEATGWSDFVFDKDYKLPTLSEVEKHIKEKQHLPDIPSEKEVKENGIDLGEMQAKLLQKIEELTLYVIEQDKQIKELKEQLNEK